MANRLADLLGRERIAMAEFLVALAEFDRLRSWMELGHSSLFYFLHRELGLSTGAAYYRKTAAELVQKYPEIIEPLRDGRLCVTSIVQLAKVITPENRREVLPRFFQRSKREAMSVAAELQPAKAVPRREVLTSALTAARIRASAAMAPVPFQPVEMNRCSSLALAPGEIPASARPSVTCSPRRGEDTQPLTGELARLHITVSKRFLQKLEAARAALSHSTPGGTAETILETGLDLILKRHATRKGIVQKPRARTAVSSPSAAAGSAGGVGAGAANGGRRRSVPAAVRREVWRRDGGRCQWPLEAGGVCESTLRVEFDHGIAWARHGPTTAENVRLLCRMHNDLAARQTFGDEWMNRFTGKRRIAGSAQTTTGLPSG